MKNFLFTVLIVTPLLALAGPAELDELADIEVRQEQLNLKKDWARYRFEKRQHECYDKFLTSLCLENARLDYRQEIRDVRQQEVPMHDRQRLLKSMLKDENDLARSKNKEAEEKAIKREQNIKSYEKKQAEEAKREADIVKRKLDADQRNQDNKKANPF
jgi:hypothetical protein